jgi:hypothetical protein
MKTRSRHSAGYHLPSGADTVRVRNGQYPVIGFRCLADRTENLAIRGVRGTGDGPDHAACRDRSRRTIPCSRSLVKVGKLARGHDRGKADQERTGLLNDFQKTPEGPRTMWRPSGEPG